MDLPNKQVCQLQELGVRIRTWQDNGKRVALCHGCFDILHVGHVRHFLSAKRGSDILVVTVTPDQFVGKGPNRPVFPGHQRAELIAALEIVDAVALNEWDGAVETLRALRPDVFVKGEEYEAAGVIPNDNFRREIEVAEELGVTVTFTRDEKLSSTSAFERMNMGESP